MGRTTHPGAQDKANFAMRAMAFELDRCTSALWSGRHARAHGIAGMAQRMREFLTAWEGYRTEAEQYRELDDGRILVLSRDTARGRTSGAETARARAQVLDLNEGKVTRLALYWDRDRALADLGLEG